MNEFYLDVIRREVSKLEEGKFTGNIEFQLNFKEGIIANTNVTLKKSVKQTE